MSLPRHLPHMKTLQMAKCLESAGQHVAGAKGRCAAGRPCQPVPWSRMEAARLHQHLPNVPQHSPAACRCTECQLEGLPGILRSWQYAPPWPRLSLVCHPTRVHIVHRNYCLSSRIGSVVVAFPMCCSKPMSHLSRRVIVVHKDAVSCFICVQAVPRHPHSASAQQACLDSVQQTFLCPCTLCP
jgi:hypothetical protein